MEISDGPFHPPCPGSDPAGTEPCTIVIFGASGDLTARKLIPALHDLYASGRLRQPISIVGCSRTVMSHAQFRAKLKDHRSGEPPAWNRFAEQLFYYPVAYDSADSFQGLAGFLRDLDQSRNTAGNRIFYLAIPPYLYPVVAGMLGGCGLAAEGTNGNGWARIVVEKPFGRDLATALELDRELHASFQEHQVFRIDHYLAKETVQNILMLRFANAIFEPVWNRSFIEYVGIIASEQLGVEHRAGYYDRAGVLRDMFQNHMMQLLALTAMEPPSLFEADRTRDEKVKVYRALKPFVTERLQDNLVLGQYGAGSIAGEPVAAYRQEPGVDPGSLTPTFALMRLFIDNWRWQGVPFYLASGKRLHHKVTRIVVQFKEVPHSMFRQLLGDHISANRLILGIYPREGISLTFQAKQPGSKFCLQPVTMDFRYDTTFNSPIPDAYENVLLDCIQGDQMLFWRQDGVELCWSFLSPILAACASCPEPEILLKNYPAGSWGPSQAEKWMRLIVNRFPDGPGPARRARG